MSNSCLIHWFEQLLFGTQVPSPPPLQLKDVILRMEAENIPWSHIILQGGLTALPYQVHGDLNILLDHLEKDWLDFQPRFKTRAVTKFWNEFQRLLARRDEIRPPVLPSPSKEDALILNEMLDYPTVDSYAFQSAQFWGEVARRFINLRRPETVAAVAPCPSKNTQRVLQLYSIECIARGQWLDPLTMHLVHHSEYLNAVHWQTPKNLEAFMRDRPLHPLTRSVQALLKRTVDQLLQGETMTAFLNPCSRHEALLHNIRVIHESVQQVPQGEETPPRLIDVFQRLLALCFRDHLWEEQIPPPSNKNLFDPCIGTLYLTEQLRIAEREKRLLWNHVTERSEEYGPKQPERTCPVVYARDREKCGREQERQIFPG